MTAEKWIKQHCGPHCYGEQDAKGVDLSLIRANLRLTPEQRLQQGDQATTEALWLREHAKRKPVSDESTRSDPT